MKFSAVTATLTSYIISVASYMMLKTEENLNAMIILSGGEPSWTLWWVILVFGISVLGWALFCTIMLIMSWEEI